LPRSPTSRWRMSSGGCPPSGRKPRPAEGDGGDRALPHRGAGRAWRRLRAVRACADRLQ
jgi:hypothetical protein